MNLLPPELPPLGHVGYIVKDVEAEAEVFRRTLGIVDFHIYDFVPQRAWADSKDLTPCALRIAVGFLKDSSKIELIQPVEGDTPQAGFLREHGPGIHHLAFYSDAYDTWRDYFLAAGAGIPFEAETEDRANGYRRSFYARIDGMTGLIEISETAHRRRGATDR